MKGSHNGMQSASRLFAILESFLETGKQMGITEVARLTGLHKSTVYRFLNAMELEGYVIKDAVTGKYDLGYKILKLARHILDNLEVREKARPYLEELADASSKAITLSVLEQGDVVCIDYVEKGHSGGVIKKVGSRVYAHCTSSGKVLLSELSPKLLRLIVKRKGLPQKTMRSITSYEKLSEELKKVRKKGYASGLRECEENRNGVAAPVRNVHGMIIAAVSINGTVDEVTEEKIISEYTDLVIKAAADISEAMNQSEFSR